MKRNIAALVVVFLSLTSFTTAFGVRISSISFCEAVSADGTIPINVESSVGDDAPSAKTEAGEKPKGPAKRDASTQEKDAGSALLGTWQCRMPAGTSILVFESDKRLSLDGQPASYTVVSNALRVQDEYGVQDYPYTLTGNVLTIAFAEGYQLQFTKISDKTEYTGEGYPSEMETEPEVYGEEQGVGEPSFGDPAVGQAPPDGDQYLMNHFAGTWWNATTNTETTVTLTPDGRYFESYTAGYSGGSSDQYGNTDMSWGTAGDQSAQGTWTVRGTREQGQLTILFQDGSQRVIDYQVHVENGEVYWSEYYFNGVLYGKKTN